MFVDPDFSVKTVLYSKRIKYSSIFFYYWLKNPNSTSHSGWSHNKLMYQIATAMELNMLSAQTKSIDLGAAILLKKHVYAVLYDAIKNGTSISLLETRKVCLKIGRDFIGNDDEIKLDFLIQFKNTLIKLSPSFVAISIFIARYLWKLLRQLRLTAIYFRSCIFNLVNQ